MAVLRPASKGRKCLFGVLKTRGTPPIDGEPDADPFFHAAINSLRFREAAAGRRPDDLLIRPVLEAKIAPSPPNPMDDSGRAAYWPVSKTSQPGSATLHSFNAALIQSTHNIQSWPLRVKDSRFEIDAAPLAGSGRRAPTAANSSWTYAVPTKPCGSSEHTGFGRPVTYAAETGDDGGDGVPSVAVLRHRQAGDAPHRFADFTYGASPNKFFYCLRHPCPLRSPPIHIHTCLCL